MNARFAHVLMLCAALVACGDPGDKLVGTWQSQDSGYDNRLELRADGTFKGKLHRASDAFEGNYSGTWQVQRGHYFGIFVTESDFAMLAPGYSFAQEVVEYDNDRFVLRTTSNHDETWIRVISAP